MLIHTSDLVLGGAALRRIKARAQIYDNRRRQVRCIYEHQLPARQPTVIINTLLRFTMQVFERLI